MTYRILPGQPTCAPRPSRPHIAIQIQRPRHSALQGIELAPRSTERALELARRTWEVASADVRGWVGRVWRGSGEDIADDLEVLVSELLHQSGI